MLVSRGFLCHPVAATTLLCVRGLASCGHCLGVDSPVWPFLSVAFPLFTEHHVFQVCPLCGVSQSSLPFEG